jgi:CMP/dCMP kinase
VTDSSAPPVIGQPAATYSGVVALDGPSGTGKSTVAKGLARRLNARYLDTGAMYRAATLAALRAGVTPNSDDENSVMAIVAALEAAQIAISTDPGAPSIRLDGESVDAEIRGGAVTAAVSAVAAVPAIRAALVAAQRELIADGGIVVEGRDIGSVVWPSANPKVYLTASAEARAARRAGELGPQADVAAVAADNDRRDKLDSNRAASPLTQVADAVELDTTYLSVDEVIDRLVDMAVKASA